MTGNSLATPSYMPTIEEMRRDLLTIGVEASTEQLNSMVTFSRLLPSRSEKINLIGPSEYRRLWRRHFLESAAYSLMLKSGRTVVDIGTGNGFPGIVLAILEYSTVLLEPKRKKYLFLKWSVSRLGLKECTVLKKRIENFRATGRCQFTARAVAPPSVLIDSISAQGPDEWSLICRQPSAPPANSNLKYMELSYPPLDRGGFLVQYRS
ncbi:MAG: hypothetical protein GF388_06655 [Candidatus Aegiribacteria sp.]|nr:hypothetical protein [Candidatus Aegiribacteria sp.]MBD3294831.1 hypothetical protein [Candidatus Fermentibacteria bacterium]